MARAKLNLTKPVYSIREFCDLFGCSDKKARELVTAHTKNGVRIEPELEARKSGRDWRIAAGAIQAWWDSLPSNRTDAA